MSPLVMIRPISNKYSGRSKLIIIHVNSVISSVIVFFPFDLNIQNLPN